MKRVTCVCDGRWLRGKKVTHSGWEMSSPGERGRESRKDGPNPQDIQKGQGRGEAGERMSWIKTSWEDVNHDLGEELQEEEENGGNSTRFQQFRASEERQSMCINLCGACFTECAGFLPKNNWWLGLLLVFKPYSTVGKVCWLDLSQARMFFFLSSQILAQYTCSLTYDVFVVFQVSCINNNFKKIQTL